MKHAGSSLQALLAIVLVLPGLAHTVGFLTPWRLGPGKRIGAFINISILALLGFGAHLR